MKTNGWYHKNNGGMGELVGSNIKIMEESGN